MLEYKQKRNNGRTPFAGVYKFVCVRLFRAFKPGTYNKRNNRVPSWKKAPVCQTCTKHMRGVAKMLEYKQKRNNGRTPFAGVYKFVCVCVCVCVCLFRHSNRGLITKRNNRVPSWKKDPRLPNVYKTYERCCENVRV